MDDNPIITPGGNRSSTEICYGGRHNLPPQVARVLDERIQNDILYWSVPDPAYSYARAMICRSLGPLIMMPCFWPHLLIIGGPICCCMAAQAQDMKATYLVLTNQTLELVEVEHDSCCIPGCYVKGANHRSIPLGAVINIATDGQDKGWATKYAPDIPLMMIDTATQGRLMLYGHQNHKELKTRILEQRDASGGIMGGLGAGLMMMQQAFAGAAGNRQQPPVINVPMVNIQQPSSSSYYADGGAGAAHAPYAPPAYGSVPSAPSLAQASSSSGVKSPSAALGELKKMLNEGLITQAEYDAKKKEILASL